MSVKQTRRTYDREFRGVNDKDLFFYRLIKLYA